MSSKRNTNSRNEIIVQTGAKPQHETVQLIQSIPPHYTVDQTTMDKMLQQLQLLQTYRQQFVQTADELEDVKLQLEDYGGGYVPFNVDIDKVTVMIPDGSAFFREHAKTLATDSQQVRDDARVRALARKAAAEVDEDKKMRK